MPRKKTHHKSPSLTPEQYGAGRRAERERASALPSGPRNARRETPSREAAALLQLARLREELLAETARLARRPGYVDGQTADKCCTRATNQMRITPLEATAIAHAFATDRRLRGKLPGVLARLRDVLPTLRDNAELQNYDCPLLENGLCLVHRQAKPIGCLAWHPAPDSASSGREHFTSIGWQAFDERDALNDSVSGPNWKVRAIPLWLKRIWGAELARADADIDSERPSTAPGRRRSSRHIGPTRHGRKQGRL